MVRMQFLGGMYTVFTVRRPRSPSSVTVRRSPTWSRTCCPTPTAAIDAVNLVLGIERGEDTIALQQYD